MTVGIGVVTGEGIVMAADSRTSITPPGGIARVVSDNTHKVFEAGNNAICTYGAAFINGRNVASHLTEFAATHQGNALGPHQCAQLLMDFLKPRLDADLAEIETPPGPEQVVLGFLVGGYSDDGAALWEVTLPQGTISEIPSPGCAWRGQTDVIRRIVMGADVDLLFAILSNAGKPELVDELKPFLQALQYRIPFDAWNLQDAVDFAVFAVRATIDTQRLTIGVGATEQLSWPGVGGPIEIAVVRPGDGFGWIQRTRLIGERAAGIAEDV